MVLARVLPDRGAGTRGRRLRTTDVEGDADVRIELFEDRNTGNKETCDNGSGR